MTLPRSSTVARAFVSAALAGGGAGLLLLAGPPTDPALLAIFVAAVAVTELLFLDFPDRRGVSLAALPVLMSAPLGADVAIWSAGLGTLVASLPRRSPRLSAFVFFRATAAATAGTAVAALIAPGGLGSPTPEQSAAPALLLAAVFSGVSEGLTLLERRGGGGSTAPSRVDLLVSLGVVPLVLAAWVLGARIGQNGLAVAGAGLLALLVVVRSSVNASTRNADLERLSAVAQEVAASSTPAESLAALARGLPPWVRVDQIWLALPVPREPPAVVTFGRVNLLPADLPLTSQLERLADEGPRPVPPELLRGRDRSVLAARYGKGGVLLFAREGRGFTSDEEDVLGLLLGQLSAILEQVRLVDELERTMAALREAQQERDDYVSVMTHDLRQPLAGVLGYAQLLERGLRAANGEERLLKYARGIATGAERMMRMVTNLLEIARVESGRIEVDAVPVKLEPLVDELVETLQGTIEQKRQSVHIDVAADLPSVVTAEPLLRESLANLIGNAIKYTPDGGRIDVRARRAGEQVEIQVADTGIGIPTDALPRIFGRFFRTGQAEVRELRGSGLGLALTKMMVEKIGGTVDVASKLGEGTTFTVRVPTRSGRERV
ncbi:MAG TPA: HAMP domain-containing sensor histidine kinase [Chloroflexota bacterium]